MPNYYLDADIKELGSPTYSHLVVSFRNANRDYCRHKVLEIIRRAYEMIVGQLYIVQESDDIPTSKLGPFTRGVLTYCFNTMVGALNCMLTEVRKREQVF